MKENSLYDKKSLKTVQGKTADFPELAKDCVAFSNSTEAATGRWESGDRGIEALDEIPYKNIKFASKRENCFRKCFYGYPNGINAVS